MSGAVIHPQDDVPLFIARRRSSDGIVVSCRKWRRVTLNEDEIKQDEGQIICSPSSNTKEQVASNPMPATSSAFTPVFVKKKKEKRT